MRTQNILNGILNTRKAKKTKRTNIKKRKPETGRQSKDKLYIQGRTEHNKGHTTYKKQKETWTKNLTKLTF